MAKKTKYNIKLDTGAEKEVEGELVNEIWGIDKRDNGLYTITHIPSGTRLWSFKTMRMCKLLLQEPEFFGDFCPKEFAKAIKRVEEKTDWKK